MVLFGKHWKEILISVLIVANLGVWFGYEQRKPTNILKVYFFDIGQGDSIFIETPSRGRLLIDGGPNRSVLSHLGKTLPFNDKRIDVLLETHPDKDHIGGLPEVVNRYEVGMLIEPGVESENSIDDELKSVIQKKNIPSILARRGMMIDFQDGVRLQILFPNQDVSRWETNDASIIAKLTYGGKSFLFTGDAPVKVENILMSLDKNILNTDVLKAGHHGSRTSTSLLFGEVVTPEFTVISAGRDNSYGHPHKETIDTINKIGSNILSTIDMGTIRIETDGTVLKIK